ncbi:MAG: hypothetical protein R3C18_26065 [Planctomycetaceae bacterium]
MNLPDNISHSGTSLESNSWKAWAADWFLGQKDRKPTSVFRTAFRAIRKLVSSPSFAAAGTARRRGQGSIRSVAAGVEVAENRIMLSAWIDGTGGPWFDASNWNGGIPTGGVDAIFLEK